MRSTAPPSIGVVGEAMVLVSTMPSSRRAVLKAPTPAAGPTLSVGWKTISNSWARRSCSARTCSQSPACAARCMRTYPEGSTLPSPGTEPSAPARYAPSTTISWPVSSVSGEPAARLAAASRRKPTSSPLESLTPVITPSAPRRSSCAAGSLACTHTGMS